MERPPSPSARAQPPLLILPQTPSSPEGWAADHEGLVSARPEDGSGPRPLIKEQDASGAGWGRGRAAHIARSRQPATGRHGGGVTRGGRLAGQQPCPNKLEPADLPA